MQAMLDPGGPTDLIDDKVALQLGMVKQMSQIYCESHGNVLSSLTLCSSSATVRPIRRNAISLLLLIWSLLRGFVREAGFYLIMGILHCSHAA